MHSSYSELTAAWHGDDQHKILNMKAHMHMTGCLLPWASAKHVYDAGDTQCGMPGKMDGS